jgi:dipeptidyl aminopeptidase/acylaminoacyl peptidase
MSNNFYRLSVVCFLLSSLLVPLHAQREVASPGFDPSPLEIKLIIKTTPRPITSMDLLTMRDVIGLQISPDGRSVAYVVSQAVHETNSYRTALFVVGTEPGSVPINLGSAGPPQWDRLGQYVRIAPQWSPDSQYITHLMGEKDRKQIWRWHRKGDKPEQLTRNPDDVQSYEWRPDGRQIIFTTVDPIRPEEIKRVAEQGIIYDSYAGEGFENSIKPWEGKYIARAAIAAKPRRKQVWIYDLAARTERKATAEEEADYNKTHLPRQVYQPTDKVYVSITETSPDGKQIAYVSMLLDPDSARHAAWAISVKDTDGGEPVELVPPSKLYIHRLWWSKDSRAIYFARDREAGEIGIYTMPARGGTMHELTKSKDLLTQISFDKDVSRVACLRENATTPPEVAVFDLKDGVLHTLANVNPEFQNIALSSVTRLEWDNKYGYKSSGYLVKPLDYELGKRYPLIVTTYGTRGFLRGAVGDEYPIQVFAANGFAVLDFSSPSRPVPKQGDFDTVMLHWYSPMASLETAVNMLNKMGVIDPTRKGLTGLSYGAEITNFTISHSDLFQAAAASSDSARDPIFFYFTNSYWHKLFKQWGLGLPEGETAARWREISPALNAARVKAPLLIQVADSEYLSGLQFYTALREHGKPVEMVIYADECHIKNQPKHRYEVYQRNIDWFNFWLQGREDPDPSKRDQFTRWRAMRDKIESQTSTSYR